MRRLMLVALGFSIASAGCSTAPARMPVRPEPNVVPNSEECHALGPFDDMPRMKLDPWPYGWALVRIDVERGVVTKAEIMDASPREIVESPTLDLFKRMHFSSLASAHGCVWSHKWG